MFGWYHITAQAVCTLHVLIFLRYMFYFEFNVALYYIRPYVLFLACIEWVHVHVLFTFQIIMVLLSGVLVKLWIVKYLCKEITWTKPKERFYVLCYCREVVCCINSSSPAQKAKHRQKFTVTATHCCQQFMYFHRKIHWVRLYMYTSLLSIHDDDTSNRIIAIYSSNFSFYVANGDSA